MAVPERLMVIIPAFREQGRIAEVVRRVRGYCQEVLVIDDGSPDATAEEAAAAGAIVVRHPRNMGKGAALKTGYTHALEAGADLVLTMDADGQHDPEDIPGFIRVREQTGAQVVVGSRMADPRTMPVVRRLTNRFMSWLLSRRMGQLVPDTQSGYRLYHKDVLPLLFTESPGFAAESEVLLDLSDHGVRIASVPIRIIYGDEKSKIRPIRDTIRFAAMLRRHGRKQRSRRHMP